MPVCDKLAESDLEGPGDNSDFCVGLLSKGASHYYSRVHEGL